MHLRAREYDPATGTLLSPDLLDGVDGTPVVANPYHYADNDPINKTDPTGLRPGESDCAAALVRVICEHQQQIIDVTISFAAGTVCGIAAAPAGPFAAGAAGAACGGAVHRALTAHHQGDNPWAAALNPQDIARDAVIGGTIGAVGTKAIGLARGLLPAAAKSLATCTDEAVFWSGIRGGARASTEWVRKHGGATLESTMEARGITLPPWDPSDAASMAAWRNASIEFARGARGNVRVLQEDLVRIRSVWARYEFPTLKGNPNVTSITALDPRTGASYVLWAR